MHTETTYNTHQCHDENFHSFFGGIMKYIIQQWQISPTDRNSIKNIPDYGSC